MPRLWSKIHFSTTQLASADIVRLWLERARNRPLDIEIYIDSSSTQPPPPTPNIWVPFHGGWVAAQPAPAPSSHPASIHWAHVVTHYLVQSMARWRRFVLRFDRHFPSMDALQSISGECPPRCRPPRYTCSRARAAQGTHRCSRSSRSAPRTRRTFPSGAPFCRAPSA
ncbi:uncharacterized protein SCHCODRAFT_085938 [Schizophyllum commune H4-8]|uniref:Expressed protein n=1 Tax=Schizophyllum commune (strain H4-8 / FGSC 9210) TaxID=578458 RepID=D8QES4_SCHCM|nr:uncharacterized protein SCHCODRAFT_085938 [Schizophyllum commune H4-8]KAI5888164.1 hypothetical protein SCHCODRAFT_085938 [Schizophyllum commune H4-8]